VDTDAVVAWAFTGIDSKVATENSAAIANILTLKFVNLTTPPLWLISALSYFLFVLFNKEKPCYSSPGESNGKIK
jgi:hypothetical protein